MTNTEIVKKLIGNIHPAGDASLDDERFENLKLMCFTVGELVELIRLVSKEKDSMYGSVKRSSKYAYEFLQEIYEFLQEIKEEI